MTLTIFMLEPVLGWSIKVFIMDKLFENWFTNILFAVIYSFGLILLWYYMILIWEKKNFTRSWEWINAKIIQIISGQPTMRLSIIENLYLRDDNI